MKKKQQYLRIDAEGKASFVDPPEIPSLKPGSSQQAVLQRAKPFSLIDDKAATAEDKRTFVHEVFETISDDYDKMNDLESFGLHRGWKKTLIRRMAQAARAQSDALATVATTTLTVLDVATGTGDIVIALAQVMPEAKVIGLDFSENMLAVAKRRSETLPQEAARVEFIHGDALNLPFADDSIDVISISFGLRNLPDYEMAIKEFVRVLRPGGSFFCLESSYPTMPLVKPVFRIYFKHMMPRMAALVTGHRQQYQWLNDSTEVFLSKQELSELMHDCGFSEIRAKSFFLGVATLHQGKLPT